MTLRKELSYFSASFLKFRDVGKNDKAVHLEFTIGDDFIILLSDIYLSTFCIAELLLQYILYMERNCYTYIF